MRKQQRLSEMQLRLKIRKLVEQVQAASDDEADDLEEMDDLDELDDFDEADESVEDEEVEDTNDSGKAWNKITAQIRAFMQTMAAGDADFDASAKSQVKKELLTIIDHAMRTVQ